MTLPATSGGVKRANVPTEELRDREAVDALGRGVGEQNAALQVGADDGVDRRVDDPLEEVLRLVELVLDRALGRDVAERAENDPLLAQHGVEVHAQDADFPALSLDANVDVLRVASLREAESQLVREARVLGGEEFADADAREGRPRCSR